MFVSTLSFYVCPLLCLGRPLPITPPRAAIVTSRFSQPDKHTHPHTHMYQLFVYLFLKLFYYFFLFSLLHSLSLLICSSPVLVGCIVVGFFHFPGQPAPRHDLKEEKSSLWSPLYPLPFPHHARHFILLTQLIDRWMIFCRLIGLSSAFFFKSVDWEEWSMKKPPTHVSLCLPLFHLTRSLLFRACISFIQKSKEK